MPVREGKDEKGPFYQYGKTGKKYHFQPSKPKSVSFAHMLASQQGKAIEISKHKK